MHSNMFLSRLTDEGADTFFFLLGAGPKSKSLSELESRTINLPFFTSVFLTARIRLDVFQNLDPTEEESYT